MKKLIYISLLALPFIAFSQTQIGETINGEDNGEELGFSTALSADGSVLAVGIPGNSDASWLAGATKVFANPNGTWVQMGDDILGEQEQERSGQSVALSGDGGTLAVGCIGNFTTGVQAGQVRIYKNLEGAWLQFGNDINGTPNGSLGADVKLSDDGTIVAISAPSLNSNTGEVRIYRYSDGTWTQIGSDIEGDATGDFFGLTISLSANGNVVAVSAYNNDSNGNADAGQVKIFENINDIWTQIGDDLIGSSAGMLFGSDVSLSADGNRVAIGAATNVAGNDGAVYVYENIDGNWTLLGNIITNEVNNENFGQPVSLSADGNIVSCGGRVPENNGAFVQTYYYNNNTWNTLGNSINTTIASPWALTLSADATTLAIGSHLASTNVGSVSVYSLSELLTNDEATTTTFSIYPNPATDIFTIQLNPSTVLKSVRVYNIIGQLVTSTNKTNVNVSNLEKGMYLVEIVTNYGKSTQKIIVE